MSSVYAALAAVIEDLPSLVGEHRRALGLTLRDAGKQSGVGFNTLSRVERGCACSTESLVAILRWLDDDYSARPG